MDCPGIALACPVLEPVLDWAPWTLPGCGPLPRVPPTAPPSSSPAAAASATPSSRPRPTASAAACRRSAWARRHRGRRCCPTAPPSWPRLLRRHPDRAVHRRRSTGTWSAPRSPTSSADSERQGVRGHERFAAAAAEAADAAGVPARPVRASATSPASAPLAELGAGSRRPARTTAPPGAPMLYTSGTTGRPKGVRRAAHRRRPGRGAAGSRPASSASSGSSPLDGNVHICGSPLYHTAVLNFAAISIQLGHTVVLMDQLDARGDAAADRAAPGHPQPHGADPVPPAAGAARRRARAGTTCPRCARMIHAAAPCPTEVKRRMLDWWGRSIVGVLRGHRGRRHRRSPPRSGCSKPGTVGTAVAGLARSGSSTTTARTLPRRRARHRLHAAWAAPSFEYHKDDGEDQREPARRASSPSATSATSTRTATCSSATARPT